MAALFSAPIRAASASVPWSSASNYQTIRDALEQGVQIPGADVVEAESYLSVRTS